MSATGERRDKEEGNSPKKNIKKRDDTPTLGDNGFYLPEGIETHVSTEVQNRKKSLRNRALRGGNRGHRYLNSM